METLKDSGTRDTFETGAVRDGATGKGAYHLLPYEAKRRWAVHMEAGASKYAARNWEKGIPLSRFMDSASRHLDKYWAGHADEDHLAAAFWNIGSLMQTEAWIAESVLPASLDDRPRYGVKHATT